MKKIYFRFRILLMTFALGLASVYLFNGSLNFSDEIRIDLPQVQSDSVIFITPTKRFCFESLATGSEGVPNTKEFIEEWKSSCLISNTVNSK